MKKKKKDKIDKLFYETNDMIINREEEIYNNMKDIIIKINVDDLIEKNTRIIIKNISKNSGIDSKIR
jgi:spore maturation protein CgeB